MVQPDLSRALPHQDKDPPAPPPASRTSSHKANSYQKVAGALGDLEVLERLLFHGTEEEDAPVFPCAGG